MHASGIFELVDRFVVCGCASTKLYFDRFVVNSCATPSYQSVVQVELMQFQPKQVGLFIFLGEPYRKGNDSCRVFILDMHIL